MTAPDKPVVLGIDLGAGSLKASLVGEDGETLGEAAHPIATATPQPGWSEQDPVDWWRALCAAVPAVLEKAAVAPERVAAVGLSGGAHIAVLEDAAGAVVRPAILWNDQRSAAEAEELHARAGDLIVEKGLNRANPTWTLCQLAWLQKHEPEAVARTARLYISKDWLRSRLTGDWTTDYSDALGALMSDGTTRSWSPEICALIDWDTATLPPVREPSDIAGTVQAAAARATGLKEGTPVVVGSNDTTVELYGAGALDAGQGAIKLATAGVVFLTAGRPEVHPPVSCYPHIMPGRWYMASGINACATAHRWVRDTFFSDLPPETAFAEMDRLASGVTPGSDGLLFHPYLLGERAPHWDPKLRGAFLGLTLGHSRAHFARACYEGIAFALNDVLLAAKDLSGATFADMRLLGGGARSATWRQIIADVTGLTVKVPVNGDASFGAALVAAVGAGLFASPEEAVARCVRIREENAPDPQRHETYQRLFSLYDQARQGLTEVNHRLHDLA
ncbi:xylulokinase [Pelagibius sp.]|uniref:xylulokinase n=1 Tax=Pelagibius sp. TaxID=1931238 RepID=UPI002635454C|nr:xylulokinase [Pelagibius sp.]